MNSLSHGLTFTWWGCCGLCFWHNPTELAHSFLFCSCVCFCLYGPFTCISFRKFSRLLSAFSLCSSGLISTLLVLSTAYLFMKVSLSPSLRAHLHVVGMLRFMSDISQPSLPTPFYFCSCVYFCLYGPFNCISLQGSSVELLSLITYLPSFTLFTGFLLNKELNTNCFSLPLNL